MGNDVDKIQQNFTKFGQFFKFHPLSLYIFVKNLLNDLKFGLDIKWISLFTKTKDFGLIVIRSSSVDIQVRMRGIWK